MVNNMEDKPIPDRKKIEGIITKKEPNMKNGPKGHFFLSNVEVEDVKFVCWSQTIFDKFDIGDEVIITYIVQENPYNGKVYHNNMISHMEYMDKGKNQFSEEEKKVLESTPNVKVKPTSDKIIKSENGKVKLGGIYYRIKNIELELIDNGEPGNI